MFDSEGWATMNSGGFCCIAAYSLVSRLIAALDAIVNEGESLSFVGDATARVSDEGKYFVGTDLAGRGNEK
jgi:hypothetical protein